MNLIEILKWKYHFILRGQEIKIIYAKRINVLILKKDFVVEEFMKIKKIIGEKIFFKFDFIFLILILKVLI